MWSRSLEHVRDPVGSLRRAFDLLRPGGACSSSCRTGAPERRLLGAETSWIHPHHISYFDRGSLARALATAGFEIERIETRPFLGVQFQFVTTLFRRLGVDGAARGFLGLGERPLEALIADDVPVECAPWRFRFALRSAHAILALWPDRLFARLGLGQKLRGFARKPA